MSASNTHSPSLPTPTSASPMVQNNVVNKTPNGFNGHPLSYGPGASPISQPPLPAAPPAPMVGSASPATPLSARTPSMTPQQAQFRPQGGPSGIPQLPSIQTALGNRLPTTLNGKLAIVEPPGQGARRSSNGMSVAFGSPTSEHQPSPKYNEDLSRLTHAVQQSVPDAVRRVVRDNWEKALLGTEFHHAFIMNAVVHHANGLIIKRAIKDFGHRLVTESKGEIIAHFNTRDLDDVADLILEKASDSFLDKALERRLGTIDARSLIDALARAERLGYENNDATDGRPDPSGPMREPFPHAQQAPPVQYQQQGFQPHPATQPLHYAPAAQPEPRQATRPAPVPSLQCPLCWRKFANPAPYEYHVKKQLCTKAPPTSGGYDFSCEHCGAGFITNVGQQYHHANKVCGNHDMASATPRVDTVMTDSPIHSVHNSPAILHAPLSRHATQSLPSQSTPLGQQHSYTPADKAKGSPSSGRANRNADPYAHLTPQTRERLDEELLAAEEVFAPRFREAEAIADPNERKVKLEGLQNSFSTKQSIIRKKYGVRLRQRRTKAEIDAERHRIATWGGTPSAKRQRTDSGADKNPTWSTQMPASLTPPVSDVHPVASTSQAAVHTAAEALSRARIPVAEMNASGLGGYRATATTTDPTTEPTSALSQSAESDMAPRAPAPSRSLSSMQKSGYRISTHASRRSTPESPEPEGKKESAPVGLSTTIEKTQSPPMGTLNRSGSAAEPFLLDESESSDSESGDDAGIPAHFPPSRIASDTPRQN